MVWVGLDVPSEVTLEERGGGRLDARRPRGVAGGHQGTDWSDVAPHRGSRRVQEWLLPESPRRSRSRLPPGSGSVKGLQTSGPQSCEGISFLHSFLVLSRRLAVAAAG